MNRATTSLPVPDSPCRNTVDCVAATCVASREHVAPAGGLADGGAAACRPVSPSRAIACAPALRAASTRSLLVAGHAREPLLDRRDQLLVGVRLGQELQRAGLDRPHRGRNVAVAGEKDDRRPRARLRQLLLQLEPAQSGQLDVQDQAARHVRPAAGEELLGGARRFRRSTRPIGRASPPPPAPTRRHQRRTPG